MKCIAFIFIDTQIHFYTGSPLSPEYHCEQCEYDGRCETQIQIQQDGTEKRHQPHQLEEQTEVGLSH